MKTLLQNPTVRLALTLMVIVSIIGGLGGVYYLGQVSNDATLKSTKSKASVNTLTSSAGTSCSLEFDITTPTNTPTPIPPTLIPPSPTLLPPVPVCVENADIAVVIDRSGTMTNMEADNRPKLEWAKDAAKAFVNTIQKSGKKNVRVSISSFAPDSEIHSQLSSDYETVKTKIGEVKYKQSGTCIQCGIRSGNTTLAQSTNAKYLILLSDGMANRNLDNASDSKDAAIKEAKAQGVIYNAVGYGDKNKSGQIDEDTLKKIAASGTYVYKPTADQWASGFMEILAKICSTSISPTTSVGTPIPSIPLATPTSPVCVVPTPNDPPIVQCAPEGGTGSVTWTWKSVAGATQYEVDILDKNGKKVIDNGWQPASVFNCATSSICRYTTLNLAVGSYKSSIRARSTNGCSPSATSLSQNIDVKTCVVAIGPQCISNPVDIVLALDRSGTMGTVKVNNKTKLEWEKQAAKAFIEVIEKQSDSTKKNIRVGVVDWAGVNSKIKTHPVESSLTAVKNFISKISYERGDVYTCMECALNAAANLFKKSDRRRIVIFMSDGIGNRIITSCDRNGTCRSPEPPKCTNDKLLSIHCAKADTDAIAIAKNVKREGISIHVVGYGTLSPKRILEDNLKAIASSANTYHYGGDETNWDTVFANIAPQICSETVSEVKTTTKRNTERNIKEGSKHDKEEGDE